MWHRRAVVQFHHDLSREFGFMEGGLVGVHLVTGGIQVHEPVAQPDRARERDLAPGDHVAFQAGRSADAGQEVLCVHSSLTEQLWIRQVLAVEPLFGEVEAAASNRDDGVAVAGVAILDPLDFEEGDAGLIQQCAAGFDDQADTVAAQSV